MLSVRVDDTVTWVSSLGGLFLSSRIARIIMARARRMV